MINLSSFAAGENEILLWALRISLFAVEAILVFMIMRMLFAWNEGRPIYLILASASAVMLFATKETAFITIGTMIIACFCILIWQKIYKVKPEENELESVALTWQNFRERIGNSNRFAFNCRRLRVHFYLSRRSVLLFIFHISGRRCRRV